MYMSLKISVRKETSALKISFQRISLGEKYMYNLI